MQHLEDRCIDGGVSPIANCFVVLREERDVHLRRYDAAGTWENIDRLKYDEVGRILLDDRYCRHCNAWMRAQPGI